MKINEIGRSMVEMLGVLAIIGVLSVGAIAGYSKAMLKYKLNKQATQYNQLLAAVYKYDGQWGKFSDDDNLIPMLKSLNEIPKEMLLNDHEFKDVFRNKITISMKQNYLAPLISIYLYLNESNDSTEICRNAFVTVKEWHENMFVMESYGIGSENVQNLQVWGDKYCKSGRKCLVNLTLSDIDNLCRSQKERQLMLYIYTANHTAKYT